MPYTVELPQVGESVTEGLIIQWLKKPGDPVARYDPLVEVETDKVTLEVPSPAAGTFLRALVKEGDTIQMGAPICELEEAPAALASRRPAATVGVLVEAGPGVGATGAQPEQPAPQEAVHPGRLSPVVQKLAAEHLVSPQELSRIKGTGLEGRVTKQDVLRYLEQRPAVGPAPAPTAAPPPLADRPELVEGRPTSPPPLAARPLGPDEEAMPLTPVRRRIAENMERATRDIPTAWTVFEVDVTELVRWRKGLKEQFQEREGVELTYLPFLLKALGECLRLHPKVNATWGGDKIVLKKRINVGVAVAAPQGLVVPVIQNTDQYSIAGLARKLHELVAKARENRLAVQDVQGGTFTLNNAGALGSMVSHAIINYPQAAILTMEAIVRKPVAVGDAIALRDRMNLTITFDHRIMDGHEAGAFMSDVKRRLEAMGPEGSLY